MGQIEQVNWTPDNNEISWIVDGQSLHKRFRSSLGSVTRLRDRSGFLAIESRHEAARDTAAIWNADGSLRCVLQNPLGPNSAYIFYYAHYVGERLHVVLASSSGDVGYFVDESTCQLSGRHEAR
jgi:hypothetical protein